MSAISKARLSLSILASKLLRHRNESPQWVATCSRCGEWLATDKKSIIAAHERYCMDNTGYVDEYKGLNVKAVAALAISGACFGAALILLSSI